MWLGISIIVLILFACLIISLVIGSITSEFQEREWEEAQRKLKE